MPWTSPASRNSAGSPGPAWLRASSELSPGTWSTPSGGAHSSRVTTGSTTSGTTGRSRRLPEPSRDPSPIPLQVAREPLPQLEPTCARGAVAPGRGHLGHLHAEQVRLDRQLDAELEAARRLDRHLVEQPLGVHPEVARGVLHRNSA